MRRLGSQLIEEALLLIMAVFMMGLILSGVQSAFTTMDKLTQNAWGDLNKILDSLFGYFWNW